MYRPINPIPGTPFYEAFETSPDLPHGQFASTLEQQVWNAMHKTCPACKGIGYHVYKRDNGVVIRENVGCEVCEGIGVILRSL